VGHGHDHQLVLLSLRNQAAHAFRRVLHDIRAVLSQFVGGPARVRVFVDVIDGPQHIVLVLDQVKPILAFCNISHEEREDVAGSDLSAGERDFDGKAPPMRVFGLHLHGLADQPAVACGDIGADVFPDLVAVRLLQQIQHRGLQHLFFRQPKQGACFQVGDDDCIMLIDRDNGIGRVKQIFIVLLGVGKELNHDFRERRLIAFGM